MIRRLRRWLAGIPARPPKIQDPYADALAVRRRQAEYLRRAPLAAGTDRP